ncbi:MAG: ABC transporter ATP-binding protein, partial [bacterium]|nr:ABC transporter ATP-binding protein [bacterium]
IMAADLILVMDAGKVVERGNHQELTATGSRYRELVAAQIEREKDGGKEL